MFKVNSDQKEILQQGTNGGRVALVYHLQIKNRAAYSCWLEKSAGLLGGPAGKRLFNISVDPAPREGMSIDEIIIDEYPSAEVALKFVATSLADLDFCCSDLTVLAVQPEAPLKLHIVRVIARLVHFFWGISDSGTPTSNWKAANTAVWPDDQQMAVAREQNLDHPLFVYNLNKNRKTAQYQNYPADSKPITGAEAYEQYSKIAGTQLLRRGAYPVYGGKPIGLLVGGISNMLADNWSKFIFVYYPQRRNLLAMIESDEFKRGQFHRDAGLERVAIFMGTGRHKQEARS